MSDTFSAMYKGEIKEFKILRPGLTESREAQKVYNTVYNDAINSKAIVRLKLENVMREQGLWGEAQQTKLLSLQRDIRDLEYKIKHKGIKLNLAKEYALKIIDLRNQISELLSERREMDGKTAEAQAENMQFNYLVSACTVYNDGSNTKVFNSLDEFLQSDEDDVTEKASIKFMEMRFGVVSSDEDLPEYKFLKRFKFVDEKLRLINKEGKLVNREGKLINEEGYLVDENNNLVDINGRPFDKDGNYLDELEFYLDDDGNPIVEEVVVKQIEDSEKEETEEPIQNE